LNSKAEIYLSNICILYGKHSPYSSKYNEKSFSRVHTLIQSELLIVFMFLLLLDIFLILIRNKNTFNSL